MSPENIKTAALNAAIAFHGNDPFKRHIESNAIIVTAREFEKYLMEDDNSKPA